MKSYIKKSALRTDYLEETTKGVMLVTLVLVVPFGIFSYLQGRYQLSALPFVGMTICTVYLWTCMRGQCNRTYVVYTVLPFIVVSMVIITHTLGVIGAYWSIPAALSLYFLLSEKYAWIVNLIYIGIIVPVAWSVLDHAIAIRFTVAIIGASLYAAIAIRVINRQQRMLKEQASTDTLTGLHNRSLLQDSLEYAIHQNHRTGTPMTLIMCDLDHFKMINDELGHDTGDSVLKAMGKLLKNYFRGSDMVFRIGGEEFLALVYNTDEQSGLDIAERLRKDIEQLPLIPNRAVTASIGVSGLRPDISWKEWMKRCDENLYRAKSNGRNQVVG